MGPGQAVGTAPLVLVRRERQRAEITALLDAVRAGLGKSTLLASTS